VHARQLQFVWDEAKAFANVRKHGVPFDYLGSLVFDWLRQQQRDALGRLSLVRPRSGNDENPAHFGSQGDAE
jgi:hypothetical protein